MILSWLKRQRSNQSSNTDTVSRNESFQLVHVQTAREIIETWARRSGEYDAIAHYTVVSSFTSLILALCEHFPPASKHVVESGSLVARLLDTSRFKTSFVLIDEFVANLKKADAKDDVSLFVFVNGAYAPSEVRKAFSRVIDNPPDAAKPKHWREAFEMAIAASRTYETNS